ncbi:MAG TPA: pitrilysin family protein [Candidatus Acidoferrales bacterium]|nr:pitrilysin family protein [Candidatus Acidoferrales bacterium]
MLASPRPAGAAPALVKLRNGLQVVLAPDSSATAVDVAVFYRVSAADEPRDESGVRHLVERLMFRGSANVADGEHVRRLTAAGGTVSTSLLPDYSCFWETVPAQAADEALVLEADRMAGLRTTSAAFEQSRRLAIADVRARAQRPLLPRAVARLSADVLAGLPGAQPLEGDEAMLAKLTPDEVDAWRRAHYGPATAVLTIVGRFEPTATLARVRQLFEPVARAGAAGATPSAPAPTAGHRVWETFDTPARLLLAGWRVPGAGDPDGPALELLAAALGHGDDARLTHSLVQDWHQAVVAQAGLDRHDAGSMLWTFAALRPDADSSTAERALLDGVGSLAREPMDGAELDRVRAQYVTSELFRLQTVRAQAEALGESALAGRELAAGTRRLDAFARLTPADLQRVAQRVFTDEARTVVWLVPRGGSR